MDLYVVNYNQPNNLYRNNGNSNHWIIIKPVGTTSTGQGLGQGRGDNWHNQRIGMDGGSGLFSQDSLWAHFGLGSNENIDTLKIKGLVERYRHS